MGFCQRINTAEGSYMCTHGKCMRDHLLVCVSISLALISVCPSLCVSTIRVYKMSYYKSYMFTPILKTLKWFFSPL